MADRDPGTFVKVEIGELESLDPAAPYDTRSWEVMANVYETLVVRSRDGFSPGLATVIPRRDNGLISADELTYTFPIREGVVFHDGSPLTADDVVWTLRRLLVTDHPNGPAWMLMEPLLGVSASRDERGEPRFAFEKLSAAIRADGNRVVLRLEHAFAPLLAILAAPAASILPMRWSVAGGEWPGTAPTWLEHNRPSLGANYLHRHMNGTGPFRFIRWEPDQVVELAGNDAYWDGPPKLRQVLLRKENEWAARKEALLDGSADIVQADRTFVPTIQGQPGVVVHDDLPLPVCDTISFNFKISTDGGNPHIGSGRLDGDGIPPDFFSDLNVRRGFLYCFDWDRIIKEVYLGKAVQCRGPIPPTIFGHNPEQPVYQLDPVLAEQELRKAWGGRLWDVGFRCTLHFNVGNFLRRRWAELMAEQLRALNDRFVLELQGTDLAENRRLLESRKSPLFTAGWLVDYPDPHSFAQPIMSSAGLWARMQSYANPEADSLVSAGVRELDADRRRAIYHRLQQIAYEDAKEIYTVDPLGLAAMRSWVEGWEYDMITGPQAITKFAPLSRAVGSAGA